jgi:hypothetical protein
MTVKKIFEIKFAYVTNHTAKTIIKNHLCHYTAPHETAICDSDGMTDNKLIGLTLIFNKLLTFLISLKL